MSDDTLWIAHPQVLVTAAGVRSTTWRSALAILTVRLYPLGNFVPG